MNSLYSAGSETAQNSGMPPLDRESEVLRAAVEILRRSLPSNWVIEDAVAATSRGADSELRIRAPDGTELLALMDVKRLLDSRDIPAVLERLRKVADRYPSESPALLLIARYLSPTTRQRIVDSGAGYIDATGNFYLARDRPSLLIRDRGADKDPWRGPGRPRGTLKGPPAARVVRALVDFAPPYSVPELARIAGASVGATYRVIEFLEEQQLIARAERGPVTAVKWRALLERWSADYGFARSNVVTSVLEPRGLRALKNRLTTSSDVDYAVTGSLASEDVAPYAPPKLAMLYVRNIQSAVSALGLRSVSSGANVALAEGEYDVVFDRTRNVGGIRVVAMSQAVVDLLSGPGRNPAEAIALLEWMEQNESVWRK